MQYSVPLVGGTGGKCRYLFGVLRTDLKGQLSRDCSALTVGGVSGPCRVRFFTECYSVFGNVYGRQPIEENFLGLFAGIHEPLNSMNSVRDACRAVTQA